MLAHSPIHSGVQPRIFALNIVIDDYPGTNRLQGCVNDGNAMVQFLRGRLFVPPQQIVTLFDRAATRRAILSTFRSHFIENENIQKGDAMVFFSGGHGSVEPVDASWLAERNKVETICPFDLDFKTVRGILRFTFDGLMQELAYSKGDNVMRCAFSCLSWKGAIHS